jgi:Fic family protein
MASEVITAIIATSGAISLAGATYWFTKKREREAELRKEKLEHYKEFVASLSGIISGEATPEGLRSFASSSNKLNLVAPQTVVKALQQFQQEIRTSSPNKSSERQDRLMSKLFLEMRKDLQVTPADKDTSFIFGLWASGVPQKHHETDPTH